MVRSEASVLRSRVARAALVLERHLGVPRQPAQLPTPLEMLIATILSQNTNDKNSHRAYHGLRARFRTWESLAVARLPQIRAAIRVGGMANQKSARIKQTLLRVKERFGKYDLSDLHASDDDQVIKELTSMPGVGVKTASCVLLFSMGRDIFPVDTHVHRICNRLGFVRTSSPDKTFDQMRSLFPRNKGYTFHTNLIRFGRSVCRSNNPACDTCPLFASCSFEGKTVTSKRKRSDSKANHDFMLLDNIMAKV